MISPKTLATPGILPRLPRPVPARVLFLFAVFILHYSLFIGGAAPALAQAVRTGTTTRIGGRPVHTSTVPTTNPAPPEARTQSSPSDIQPSSPSDLSDRPLSPIIAGFKYNPPPPPKPRDEEVDLRDIDKPKNEIIRLPAMVVTAKKPPVFTDRMLYTQDQLKTLAISRHLSKLDTSFLNRWTLPFLGVSNAERAMQIYLDEERQKKMEEAQQQISTTEAAGDTDAAKQMKSEYYDMFLRPPAKPNTPPDSLLRQRGQ